MDKAQQTDDPPWLRGMYRAALAGGPVVTALAGATAKLHLQSQGVPTVSWLRGTQLLVPLAVWAEVPFLVLALIGRRLVRRAAARAPGALPGWRALGLGALAGLYLAIGYLLLDTLSYAGPGGAAQAVSMLLILSPLTLPLALAAGLAGAITGGVLARLAWGLRARLVR